MSELNLSGKVLVKGCAKEEYLCDMVKINIRVHSSDASGAKASEAVTRQTELLLKDLAKAGYDITSISLESDRISDMSRAGNEKVSAARELEINSAVKDRMIEVILRLIQEEHLDAYVTTDYYLSNEFDLRRLLREKAVIDSRENAELLAHAAGKEIVGVDTIDMDPHWNPVRTSKVDYMMQEGERAFPDLFSYMLAAPKKGLSEEIHVTWLLK